jgi:pilus assembly protein FimV
MRDKLPRLAVLACLFAPTWSWALGLGEIRLNSALNEPLNAEIDLVAAAPEELTSLRATLAPRDTFQRYGIDRPAFLNSLNFKVGHAADGHDALLVRSSEAISEPFVTFLVEVNWARGRVVREYTLLLDPPVYTPGEARHAGAPVAVPQTSNPQTAQSGEISRPAPTEAPESSQTSAPPAAGPSEASGNYEVKSGDTLMGITRSLSSGGASEQLMMAIFQANPQAFDGNVNLLHKGAILRVPGADEVAAVNQSKATADFRAQMAAWRGTHESKAAHLRLVTPGAAQGTSGSQTENNAEAQALKDRVHDLESQLAQSKHLIDLRNTELAELQRKLGETPSKTPPPEAAATPAPPPPATTPSPATPPAATETPPAAPATPAATAPPPAPPKPVQVAPPPAPPSGSWLDWLMANWYLPAAILALLLGALGFTAWKRRQADASDFGALTSAAGNVGLGTQARAQRRTEESIVVEESGEHERPDFGAAAARFATDEDEHAATAPPVRAVEGKSADDTISSETAINLEQGDPLAEADFHMAYGLYDQAADLVRIAIEREPDRRDLKLKLLEIFFVWGNKDAFLQAAKELHETRSRAAAGEWDKIVIMGKQICPDETLFTQSVGGGMGAGALVDLNLEGGENRIDIDLYGDGEAPPAPAGSEEPTVEKRVASATERTDKHEVLNGDGDLDFVLDSPHRGDDSPTHEMPRQIGGAGDTRESPTVESPAAAATTEMSGVRERIQSKLDAPRTDQTAELALDDLGLDLRGLDDSRSSATLDDSNLRSTGHPLERTDHPDEAPTMVAGLDERSRRLMEEAEARVRDRDLTELERELEASFIAELDEAGQVDTKTAIIGPETAPTKVMPKPEEESLSNTARLRALEASDRLDAERADVNSTSRLRGISAGASEHSIDLDLDSLASALGTGDTVEQPRSVEAVFSSEVFDASRHDGKVDLDVGVPLDSADHSATATAKLKPQEVNPPELEPVTMSEVGTKLDLARAYMDMGDPEGARSILEEVVAEGSASQKQEAQRLIESLPG